MYSCRHDCGRLVRVLRALICRKNAFTLSLLRVTNVKLPLQLYQKYCITQYGELGYSQLTQMEHDYTANSRYLTEYMFSLKGSENVDSELRSKKVYDFSVLKPQPVSCKRSELLLCINPFTPNSDQFKISPATLPDYITSHSMKNLAFHSLHR